MITHFLLLPLLLVFIVLRAVTRSLRHARRSGSPMGYGYSRRFGSIYGRRRGFGGGLLPILALVALERFFTHRRW